MRREHGYQAVGKAHNARLEYEAALKRGTVWVTHANGTERVYDTKAAAESRNEGPIYEELAEWWDLEGSEPVGVGEYRQIDLDTDEEDGGDPLPQRIKGVVRPEARPWPDDQNYSEAKSENATAQQHHPWEYATHNRRHARSLPPASEEWYTPSKLFQAMGCTFDLDPASPGANVVHWIPAKRHFTRSDNGLEQDWNDDFVWLNAPYTKENLPRWLEKFRKHANGVCLTVDRSSARWWQDLSANADLILQSNKKIQFLRPPDEPTYSSPALGHTLVAYGPRGAAALRNAARNGVGTLFTPSTKSEARIVELERELASLKEKADREQKPKIESNHCYRTPTPLYSVLDRLFHFDFDPCPADRPPNFNSLDGPWGQSNYVNSPFSAQRNPERHGPTAFARKAIAENLLGKNAVVVAPTMNYVNLLLENGAEPFALGLVPWEDARTGQTHPSPPNITGFVLWGEQYTAADRVAIMRRLKAEIRKLHY